jgi:3-hydroxyacyl-CoA dehydrogenase
LGKGTVRAKDRPAFIANRLGVHGMLTALALADELGLGVDEVDELTGPLIGRPKSAIFRTLDLVGLDVALAVADHCHEALVDDPQRARFEAPPILRQLVEQGRLGEKTGAGFYRREDTEILALDLATGEYRPRRRVQSGPLELARLEPDLRRRLVALVDAAASNPDDPAACLLWRLLGSSLGYAIAVGAEIADDAPTVDRAMRWGFGWEAGPFELREIVGDRLGVPEVPETFRTFAAPRPSTLDPVARRGATPDLPANASGTVVDLGDGILGVELHARLNLIGIDTLGLLRRAVEIATDRFDGLVVGTQAADFSVGANLALLLMEAEEGEWDELDRAVRLFQAVAIGIRSAPVPVVVAARGRTLGGGAELCLAADRCQPLAETYLGLVETGVGLIPAGGGTTAMARRVAERVPDGVHGDTFAFFRSALETIALARVSTSAEEARALGYLTPADLVTVDPDRQWHDAVATARHLADVGYRPPAERPIRVVGRRGIAAADALSYNQLLARQMSEHDRTVVLALARVMSGGDVAEGTELSAGYLLDLEREAFLRLLGEPLTRARIRHTLKTGKPLGN